MVSSRETPVCSSQPKACQGSAAELALQAGAAGGCGSREGRPQLQTVSDGWRVAHRETPGFTGLPVPPLRERKRLGKHAWRIGSKGASQRSRTPGTGRSSKRMRKPETDGCGADGFAGGSESVTRRNTLDCETSCAAAAEARGARQAIRRARPNGRSEERRTDRPKNKGSEIRDRSDATSEAACEPPGSLPGVFRDPLR